MNSKRQQVFDKYNGRCAYCGCELENNWQVDHITPKKHYEWNLIYGNPNDINNLMPSCRKCNHYKRCLSLEGFRYYMQSFHNRLSKLPKKTKIKKTEERITYMQDIAQRYGITTDNPFGGKFYFEMVNQTI